MTSSPKLPVSVVLIARNEEKNLERCLKSIAWATEIVAVINDCTDRTEEILHSFGAKVHKHEWKGFIQQKNKALSYATQPWIFSIDADEEVPPHLKSEIEKLIAEKDVQAVSFRRKTHLMGRWIKHGDWYPDRIVRLWRNGVARFVGNYQHEILQVDVKVHRSQANILHYSYPSIYDFLKKTESFARGFEIENPSGTRSFCALTAFFRAKWRFLRCYFFRLGFLDGFPGLFVATYQFYSTFFKYSIVYDQQQRTKAPVLDQEDLKT